MTFAEKVSHVAKDDPKFARSVKRMRVASWIFGLAVAAALAFALWSLSIGFSNQTQITKIESPCLRYGAKSQQCKRAFEQAVLTITHAQACAILRKAGLEIHPCAHARLRQEYRRGEERAANREKAAGGGALHAGSTGHQPTSPHHGGGAKNGPQNPSSPGKAPSQPKEAPRTVGSAPASGGESSSSSPDQGSSKPPGLVEHAAGVAQEAAGEVTGSVGSAVEGIGGVAEGGVCGTVAAPGCSK